MICQSALKRIKEGTTGYKGEEQKKSYAENAFNVA
jgi:hypothetical protein